MWHKALLVHMALTKVIYYVSNHYQCRMALFSIVLCFTYILAFFFFFLEREFQPMMSLLNDSSLSLDHNTNRFLVWYL